MKTVYLKSDYLVHNINACRTEGRITDNAFGTASVFLENSFSLRVTPTYFLPNA